MASPPRETDAREPDPLEAIRERLAKSTPGPWEARQESIYKTGEEFVALIYDNGHCDDCYTHLLPGDWQFIAAAPADLSWCIAEIERLRGVSPDSGTGAPTENQKEWDDPDKHLAEADHFGYSPDPWAVEIVRLRLEVAALRAVSPPAPGEPG